MDLSRIATSMSSRRYFFAKGDQGDLLHEVGRDAELGPDADSQATHTDLELDDLENVDNRPKQGTSLESVARRLAAVLGDMVKIHVTEDPNRVEVKYLGETHSASWDDEEQLSDVSGDEDILRAAMSAWDGSEEMEMSAEDLSEAGDGWWSLPEGVADDKDMWDAISVSISWDPAKRGFKKSGPGGPSALDTVYGLIIQAGYQPNGFELEQEEPRSVTGNLGVSKGLYESVEQGDGFWEAEQGDVKVEFEVPYGDPKQGSSLESVAARMAGIPAVMEISTSDSLEGPWRPSSAETAAEEVLRRIKKVWGVPDTAVSPDQIWGSISSRLNSEEGTGRDENPYADTGNGVLLFFKKDNKIFSVVDVFAVHAGDAQSTFEVKEVDDEGMSTGEEDDFVESGNDIGAIISSALSANSADMPGSTAGFTERSPEVEKIYKEYAHMEDADPDLGELVENYFRNVTDDDPATPDGLREYLDSYDDGGDDDEDET